DPGHEEGGLRLRGAVLERVVHESEIEPLALGGERDLDRSIEPPQREAEIAGEQIARTERDDAEWEGVGGERRADGAYRSVAARRDDEIAALVDGALNESIRG